jgi:hypothetical protein
MVDRHIHSPIMRLARCQSRPCDLTPSLIFPGRGTALGPLGGPPCAALRLLALLSESG